MTRSGAPPDNGPVARMHPERPRPSWTNVILRVVGAGLLFATAAIHLDLYVTGYRTIPTIGWLFLLQVIAAFGLGLAVLAIPRRFVVAGRLAAAAGAGFSLATFGGYLLSAWIGLFGFKEVRTGAGIAAGVVEVAAFAVLAVLAFGPAPADDAKDRAAAAPHRLDQIPRTVTRAAEVITAGLTVVALVLLGVVLARDNPPEATASGTGLQTTTIGGTTVLTDAKGFTLYSFAPDTPTTSKCYGTCAAYWPPVIGKPTISRGVPGRVDTIKRTDGSAQIAYNGHPLYTYIADTAPGQARGNNLNLNGGVWHVVPVGP